MKWIILSIFQQILIWKLNLILIFCPEIIWNTVGTYVVQQQFVLRLKKWWFVKRRNYLSILNNFPVNINRGKYCPSVSRDFLRFLMMHFYKYVLGKKQKKCGLGIPTLMQIPLVSTQNVGPIQCNVNQRS